MSATYTGYYQGSEKRAGSSDSPAPGRGVEAARGRRARREKRPGFVQKRLICSSWSVSLRGRWLIWRAFDARWVPSMVGTRAQPLPPQLCASPQAPFFFFFLTLGFFFFFLFFFFLFLVLVGAIAAFSFYRPPEHQHLSEGNFYTQLVPRF